MSEAAPTPAPAKRRVPRWLWIGFFVSVGLNLLVIGLAVGAAWHFHVSREFRQHGAPRHFGAFLRHLPKERRKEFRALARRERPEFIKLREALRAARREAEELFGSEPFDREKFAAAHSRLHEARARLRGARSTMFPEIAAEMTAEERQLFLEWNRRHHKRWRRWRKRYDEE